MAGRPIQEQLPVRDQAGLVARCAGRGLRLLPICEYCIHLEVPPKGLCRMQKRLCHPRLTCPLQSQNNVAVGKQLNSFGSVPGLVSPPFGHSPFVETV